VKILYCLEFECAARNLASTKQFARQVAQHRRMALFGVPTGLVPMRNHCTGCPANALGREFGCTGKVSIPLMEAAEYWLLAQLPARLDGERGRLLRQLVDIVNFDGADDFRRSVALNGRRGAPVRSWGRLKRWSLSLTSSRLLYLLLGAGRVQAGQARLLTLLMGLQNGVPANVPDGPLGRQFAELLGFLQILDCAAALATPIELEYC